MTVVTELEGLKDIEEYLKTFPARTRKASRLAINMVVAREGLKSIRNEMMNEVAFPNGYLKGDRLGVTQYATESNLTGVITARKRATSLARFAAPGTAIGSLARSGVSVQVKRGSRTTLKGAWLVRLNKGASLTEDQYNVGLAVRVRPGDTIRGKHSAHTSWLVPGQVALLYGPSVNQVFRDVAETQSKEILDLLGDEFFRQFNRLGP